MVKLAHSNKPLSFNTLNIEYFSYTAERTIIVSEYVGQPLTEKPYHIYDDILRIFYQIACGLEHMQKLNFTMQTLEPKNVLVDELGNVKLFNYGMFHQTDRGDLVTFPIGFVCFSLKNYRPKMLC